MKARLSRRPAWLPLEGPTRSPGRTDSRRAGQRSRWLSGRRAGQGCAPRAGVGSVAVWGGPGLGAVTGRSRIRPGCALQPPTGEPGRVTPKSDGRGCPRARGGVGEPTRSRCRRRGGPGPAACLVVSTPRPPSHLRTCRGAGAGPRPPRPARSMGTDPGPRCSRGPQPLPTGPAELQGTTCPGSLGAPVPGPRFQRPLRPRDRHRPPRPVAPAAPRGSLSASGHTRAVLTPPNRSRGARPLRVCGENSESKASLRAIDSATEPRSPQAPHAREDKSLWGNGGFK